MSETKRATARDLMRTDVATLSSDDTIETAMALFEESRISGAPVLTNGRLVGMLTLADIGRTEHLKEGRIETGHELELSEPAGEERTDELDPDEVITLKDDYSPMVLGRELVGDWMSSGVVAVPPDTPLEQVCEVMVRDQIHRVCVIEDGRLVGLVTSFDVVRHVARGKPGGAGRRGAAAPKPASRHKRASRSRS